MPKKKSSRPNNQLGSREVTDPKSSSQIRRDRIVKTGAILIVLALLLSLIAGAVSISPARAANSVASGKTVQIHSVDQELVDTDEDGLENNQDSDVDGDGIVNGEDTDIDGDGFENFDDADPIGVLGIDSNSPEKPNRPVPAGDKIIAESLPIFGFVIAASAAVLFFILLAKRRKNKPKK